MTTTPPLTESAIVLRLRAAGCVFAEDEARLLVSADVSAARLAELVELRVAGFPLEPLLGWAEFCGLRIGVDPGVFVPRQRTEFLVREAAARTPPRAVVLDLCCGSGALGMALAAIVGGGREVELVAADLEPAAVTNARRNLEPLGGRVFEGDLFEPLPPELRGRVDILLCNTPYVPSDRIATMPPEARLHEPRMTLDGGVDGLDLQRRVAAEAARWLSPGGHLFVEASEDQAPQTAELFRDSGLRPRILHSEELYATIVIGTRPA